jgi:ectoine hydroxylase-related dioxygenase (phytanoyl-CoA dioxygenase family)
MLLEKFLDKNYKQLPDFWAWHVSSGQSGWAPHRDKVKGSLFENNIPKSLTVWIPLSKASPNNSCMYVLPANKDNFYNKPKLNKNFPGVLSDIRALPAEAGDVLMWTQEVYHWGSSSGEDSLNEPRISIAFEFQRSDVAPFNTLLLEPNLLPTFNDRLALISMQILQYTHMYGFKKDLVYWAQSYIEKYKKELSLV